MSSTKQRTKEERVQMLQEGYTEMTGRKTPDHTSTLHDNDLFSAFMAGAAWVIVQLSKDAGDLDQVLEHALKDV